MFDKTFDFVMLDVSFDWPNDTKLQISKSREKVNFIKTLLCLRHKIA